jgi:methylmalonyl-CoA mutase cobalamin-binding domain/chain
LERAPQVNRIANRRPYDALPILIKEGSKEPASGVAVLELAQQGRPDILIVAGGVIPPDDYAALCEAGAVAIFGPGTNITEAAADLLVKLNAHLGYAQASAAE